MSEANEITANLLIKIPEQFPNVRVWRNNRVKAMAMGRGGKPRMIDAGIDGQGDITGILSVPIPGAAMRCIGIKLEIEVKAGSDRQSAAQQNFQRMIEGFGGVYILARNVDAALADISHRARIYSMSLLQPCVHCEAVAQKQPKVL